MRNLCAITRRELTSAFYSPMAYVVLTVFLVITGIVFPIIINPAGGEAAMRNPADANDIHHLLGLMGSLLIFTAPLLTLRLVAEEQRSGTIETLMTTPVSDSEVVVGKWLAVSIFYSFILAFTWAYVAIIAYFGDPDWGPIFAHYIGLVLLGGMFLAVGVFGSSLTRSQIVAGIVTFVVIFVYLLLGWLGEWIGGAHGKFLSQLGAFRHLASLAEGHVDTRDVVYFITMTALWLFLGTRVLESRKWR